MMAHVELNKTKRGDAWLIDSGCSNHMTGDKGCFSDLEKNFNLTVKLGNYTKMVVVVKGSVRVQVNGIILVITDVYYIPELRNNLLSVGQLQEKCLAILIQDGTCRVFHPRRGVIMQISMSGNIMFYLLASRPLKSPICLQAE